MFNKIFKKQEIEANTTNEVEIITLISNLESLKNKIKIKKREYYAEVMNHIKPYSKEKVKYLYETIIGLLNKKQSVDCKKEVMYFDILDFDFTSSYYDYPMASREGVEFVESYHIMENGNLVLNLKQELKNKTIERTERHEVGKWKLITETKEYEYHLTKEEQKLLNQARKYLNENTK